MNHFLKSLLIFVTILLQFYVFHFWLWGMWDLVPRSGIKPTTPATEREVLTTTGLPGKSQTFLFYIKKERNIEILCSLKNLTSSNQAIFDRDANTKKESVFLLSRGKTKPWTLSLGTRWSSGTNSTSHGRYQLSKLLQLLSSCFQSFPLIETPNCKVYILTIGDGLTFRCYSWKRPKSYCSSQTEFASRNAS